MSEIDTIRECQQGNLEAFTELYDTYVTPLYQFVFYKTFHRETAEDLTSAAFMRAMEKIGTFDPERASFKTWLYSIARNLVIDHYRSNKPESDIEDVVGLSGKQDVEAEADLRLKVERVKERLKDLSEDQREVILLRVWGERSFAEIAEITGKSEASCKMAFKRGVEKLKGLMATLVLLANLIN